MDASVMPSIAVNVKALFLLLQDEVKQMLAQGCGGSIVNAALRGCSNPVDWHSRCNSSDMLLEAQDGPVEEPASVAEKERC